MGTLKYTKLKAGYFHFYFKQRKYIYNRAKETIGDYTYYFGFFFLHKENSDGIHLYLWRKNNLKK